MKFKMDSLILFILIIIENICGNVCPPALIWSTFGLMDQLDNVVVTNYCEVYIYVYPNIQLSTYDYSFILSPQLFVCDFWAVGFYELYTKPFYIITIYSFLCVPIYILSTCNNLILHQNKGVRALEIFVWLEVIIVKDSPDEFFGLSIV